MKNFLSRRVLSACLLITLGLAFSFNQSKAVCDAYPGLNNGVCRDATVTFPSGVVRTYKLCGDVIMQDDEVDCIKGGVGGGEIDP